MSATTLPGSAGAAGRNGRGAGARVRALARGRALTYRPTIGLVVLLTATTAAYLWNLTASGDANSFYAAAVQAGTKSWKAFLFGSIDSSNFITVDKPPGSLWVMALSGRIFGFSSFSMLAPQVLEGVAAVGLLYGSVRRWFGESAGLTAGALLAVTPVAALMFRFNNPDALLVCLLVAGAYCMTRAIETGRTRWIVAVGTAVGFAFLAKMMQAFLVVPAFGLVYLVAAPPPLRRRIAQLLAGLAAMIVSAGWWVALVALWPVGSRPMIDGSPDNNIFNLILGYNGLGRIFGSGGPGGSGPGASFSGPVGLLRLFDNAMGGQASWLLGPALLTLVLGLFSTRRAPRTDRTRAALLMWGGWLIVTGLVFSLSTGIIHTYYAVALAPAIAALVAIGATLAWRRREQLIARVWVAVAVAGTAAWAVVLLARTPSWEPWLRPLIIVAAVLAVVALIGAPALGRLGGLGRLGRLGSAIAAVLAAVVCLAGPLAFTGQTLASAHTGSIPSAGPTASAGGGFGGGGARGGGASGSGGGGSAGGQTVSSTLVKALEQDSSSYRWVAAVDGSQTAATLELASGGEPVMAIGGFNNNGGNLTLAQFERYVKTGEIRYYVASGDGAGGAGAPGGRGFGAGGGRAPGSGGGAFPGGGVPRGGGPLSAGGSRAGQPGATAGGHLGGSSTSAITTWVKAHYKAVTIGGEVVYDLTQAKA